MKHYNFDRVIDRKGSGSLKHDFAAEWGKPEDVVPLWVADMDFRVCDEIIDALKTEVEFGIFGYNSTKRDYFEAVASWFERRFLWAPQEEWLVQTPGVVFAFSNAIRSLTLPGDAVIIQPPVYYPFANAINNNGRKLVENPLVLRDGKYEIDFDDFEKKIKENNVKLFLLCSPHNPVGRVWDPEELKRLGGICKENGVIIVADEIHCDFVWPGKKHHMFLEACPEYREFAISCTAPSKTFNLAGMQASNIWIPNKELREKFRQELMALGTFHINNMGIVACKAAYEHGETWFDECLEYMRGNYEYVRGYVEQYLPRIKFMETEGTYFAWLDFSGLGMEREALDSFILNKAKLWVDEGHIFGTGGEGFQRILLCCPRAILEDAMARLENAIAEL